MSICTSPMITGDYQPLSLFYIALLFHSSLLRANTRFITRCIDVMRNVDNLFGTEKLILPANNIHKNSENMWSSSFNIIHGRISVFWYQNNSISRLPSEVDEDLDAGRLALTFNFDVLRNKYGDILGSSLGERAWCSAWYGGAWVRSSWPANCCYFSTLFFQLQVKVKLM